MFKPEGDKWCLVVCVCAFIVSVWSKYDLSLKITAADVVKRKAVLREVWGQEGEVIVVVCEGQPDGEKWAFFDVAPLFLSMLMLSYRLYLPTDHRSLGSGTMLH